MFTREFVRTAMSLCGVPSETDHDMTVPDRMYLSSLGERKQITSLSPFGDTGKVLVVMGQEWRIVGPTRAITCEVDEKYPKELDDITLLLKNPYDSDFFLKCPICSDDDGNADYVHFDGEPKFCKSKYGDPYLKIAMDAECNHAWTVVLAYHGGSIRIYIEDVHSNEPELPTVDDDEDIPF